MNIKMLTLGAEDFPEGLIQIPSPSKVHALGSNHWAPY
jgi:hypothetical protein